MQLGVLLTTLLIVSMLFVPIVVAQAKGNYYNYDFGNPNQATYTNHLSQIQGKNSNAYSWSDVHSGEYWWLLWGRVYVDGG